MSMLILEFPLPFGRESVSESVSGLALESVSESVLDRVSAVALGPVGVGVELGSVCDALAVSALVELYGRAVPVTAGQLCARFRLATLLPSPSQSECCSCPLPADPFDRFALIFLAKASTARPFFASQSNMHVTPMTICVRDLQEGENNNTEDSKLSLQHRVLFKSAHAGN